jgi:hypothetical protein
MTREIIRKPEITIIEPKQNIKVEEDKQCFFDNYSAIKKNTITFWQIFSNNEKVHKMFVDF